MKVLNMNIPEQYTIPANIVNGLYFSTVPFTEISLH